MNFASDNTGPAHPSVMEAVIKANEGYAMPYAEDTGMERVRDALRATFEAPEAEVFLVPTGSAANGIALSTLVNPWEAIYCSGVAHVHVDECGGPEFYSGGAKLVLVPETDARMTAADLEATISEGLERGLHYVQPGAVSITQVTERGTVYSLDALRALTGVAKAHGLPVHLDGARFANALVTLGCTPAEMSWKAGVDAVIFGATKNGCLGVEAIVLFDPARAGELAFRRKRGGHLFSKNRFLSAQMEGYLAGGQWLASAEAANAMGARLAQGLAQSPDADLLHPVEANMLFVSITRAAHRRLVEAGAQYYMTLEDLEGGTPDDLIPTRLVTNWSTTEAEVDQFLETMRP